MKTILILLLLGRAGEVPTAITIMFDSMLACQTARLQIGAGLFNSADPRPQEDRRSTCISLSTGADH